MKSLEEFRFINYHRILEARIRFMRALEIYRNIDLSAHPSFKYRIDLDSRGGYFRVLGSEKATGWIVLDFTLPIDFLVKNFRLLNLGQDEYFYYETTEIDNYSRVTSQGKVADGDFYDPDRLGPESLLVTSGAGLSGIENFRNFLGSLKVKIHSLVRYLEDLESIPRARYSKVSSVVV